MYSYSLFFFLRALFRYDIFHFLSGETILTRKLQGFELCVYKLLGKKVIMHFVGADIRSNNYLLIKNDHLEDFLAGKKLNHPKSELYQQKLIKRSRKYADKIIVSTPDLLQIIPESLYIPVVIDLETIVPHFNTLASNMRKTPIRIFHSPSGTKTKGSQHIHRILERLKQDFPDKLELILPSLNRNDKDYSYALTRYELLNTLNEVDIVIDQMLIGWYGLKSLEALAAGCEVVCYLDKEVAQNKFPDSPIHESSILELEAVLRELIERLLINNDRSARRDIQLSWIRKYHIIERYSEEFRTLWTR